MGTDPWAGSKREAPHLGPGSLPEGQCGWLQAVRSWKSDW